ncbi:MAG: nucleoside 2-deoxyribosyltransferase [Planctomycetaceae bacterium]|nr:nucleoside 2-deoxyribosyltransferase [Planctomycetaceae bacterium]
MSRLSPEDDSCVYCAGPLFCQSEREEMMEIAEILVDHGYRVYLPHRDGMEFRLIHEILVERGWEAPDAAQFLHAAIFALDVYQLAVECDCMVWNLNGRVPDEGAVSEAAMAWTLGKPLVGYKDDVRSLIAGRVNPLLVGMTDFQTVENIEEIPHALALARTRQIQPPLNEEYFSERMKIAVTDGGELWNALSDELASDDNEFIADVVARLFSPEKTPTLQV